MVLVKGIVKSLIERVEDRKTIEKHRANGPVFKGFCLIYHQVYSKNE